MNYKVIILTAILSVIVLFGGCSSTITIGLHTLPDGSIRQMYTVSLDRAELSTLYTDEEISTIFNVTHAYLERYVENVESEAEQCAQENGYSTINPHCIGGVEYNTDELTITAVVLFSSAQFYNLYNEYVSGETPSDDQESSTTVEEGLFYDKNIYLSTKNPVADENSILSVYNSIESALAGQNISFNFDIKQLNLAYDYAILYTDAQVARIRSNADREYVQTETNTLTGLTYQMKHFVWNYDADGDNNISLYSYSIHSVSWYITALILVVIFGAVIYIVYIIKKRKSVAVSKQTTDMGEIVDAKKVDEFVGNNVESSANQADFDSNMSKIETDSNINNANIGNGADLDSVSKDTNAKPVDANSEKPKDD